MEVNKELRHYFTRFVVPFAYDRSVLEEEASTYQDNWELRKSRLDINVQSHVKTFLSDSKSFSEYTILYKARKQMGLPHNPNVRLNIQRHRGNDSYIFRLQEIQLFLLDGMGFLVLNIEAEPNTLEALAVVNQLLKRSLGEYSGVTIRYEQRNGKHESTIVELDIKSIIKNLLSPFTSEGSNYEPYLYTSAVMEKMSQYDEVQANRDLSSLIQNYSNQEDEMVSFVEGSYWKISLEGTACLSILDEDERMNNYILYASFPRSRTGEFYLMLLALYQRLYLMNFYSFANSADVQKDAVIEVEKRLAFFKLKACFSQISNSSMTQSFYETLRSVFSVEKILSEVYREIQDLSTLVRQQIEKEEQEDRDRDDKRNRIISLFVITITTIFVMISTSNDGWSIANLLDQPAVPESPLAYKVFIGVLIGTWGIFPLLLIALFIILKMSSKRK